MDLKNICTWDGGVHFWYVPDMTLCIQLFLTIICQRHSNYWAFCCVQVNFVQKSLLQNFEEDMKRN